MPLGPFFQGGARLGTPGQDAFDGVGGEGPVADGAFQGGDNASRSHARNSARLCWFNHDSIRASWSSSRASCLLKRLPATLKRGSHAGQINWFASANA